MQCIFCNSYFKQSKFNNTNVCEDCNGNESSVLDEDVELELQMLKNPSGKVQAKIDE